MKAEASDGLGQFPEPLFGIPFGPLSFVPGGRGRPPDQYLPETTVQQGRKSFDKYHQKGHFVCNVDNCGQQFAYQTNLRRHERVKHGYYRGPKKSKI